MTCCCCSCCWPVAAPAAGSCFILPRGDSGLGLWLLVPFLAAPLPKVRAARKGCAPRPPKPCPVRTGAAPGLLLRSCLICCSTGAAAGAAAAAAAAAGCCTGSPSAAAPAAAASVSSAPPAAAAAAAAAAAPSADPRLVLPLPSPLGARGLGSVVLHSTGAGQRRGRAACGESVSQGPNCCAIQTPFVGDMTLGWESLLLTAQNQAVLKSVALPVLRPSVL